MMKKNRCSLIIIFIAIILFYSASSSYIFSNKCDTTTSKSHLSERELKITGIYSSNQPSENEFKIMHPDKETRIRWIESHNNAPKIEVIHNFNYKFDYDLNRGNYSILNLLEYNPSERDQGQCGNCWAWAATGCLEIALNSLKGIKDRLSVQYINSCESSIIGVICCDGGSLYDFVSFYNNTCKAIPWSNDNASWQDGNKSCDTECNDISKNPRYPLDHISEISIPTHNIDKNLSIANIKSVLDQNKGVWFAFYLPNNNAFLEFCNFWLLNNTEDIYNIDKYCDIPITGNYGHAVLCVGYNDEDPDNSYWTILNSWGNSTNRPKGLIRINMDMNYSGKNPGIGLDDYSFYWQTLNVTYNLYLPEINLNQTNNIQETTATLNGYLNDNGSVDTNCYFVWTNNSGEQYLFNYSMGIISNNSEFNHNIENLTIGELYYYDVKANNIAGWNNSGEMKFLTKPDSISSFTAEMIDDEKINLTWIDNDGGKGAYIEFMTDINPPSWEIGNGTKVSDDGYISSPYIHDNLSSNTNYYYKAWAFADDDGWFSNGNNSAPFSDNPKITNNRTNGIINIINEIPENGSTSVDISLNSINLTVMDPNGDMINWEIDGYYIIKNNNTNDSNGSKNATLLCPLPYTKKINWFINTSDGINYVNRSFYFITREKYNPDPPSSFSTIAFNRTQINLTWINGNRSDKTYIRYKLGLFGPSNLTDGIELGNFSKNNATLDGLDFGTQYSFTAWGWNDTDACYSNLTSFNDTITNENAIPFSSFEYPFNSSLNVTLQPICNVTVYDLDEVFLNVFFCENSTGAWKTIQSNVSISSGSNVIWNKFINASNFSTMYWWSVNITDGYNWNNKTYSFTTIPEYFPRMPSNFDVIFYGKKSLKLKWDIGDNCDKTYIRYLEGKNAPIDIYDGLELGNFTENKTIVGSLNSGKWYTFRAWGYNDTFNLFSVNSAVCSARTKSSTGGSGGTTVTIPVDDNSKEESILNGININFNLNLTENFTLIDINNDGVIDEFFDPNGLIEAIRSFSYSNTTLFLLNIKEKPSVLFICNMENGNIENVSYLPGIIKNKIFDPSNDSFHVILSVDKSDWIYFDCEDIYPNIVNLTVYTKSGRLINGNLIWRENNNVFVLDDPETEYKFTYKYTILEPEIEPYDNLIFNISKPEIDLKYYENVSIISAFLNDEVVNLSSVDSKNFTFTPLYELPNGSYHFEITVKDLEKFTRTDSMFFSINVEKSPEKRENESNFLILIIIILVVVLIVIIILFKTGFIRYV